MHLRALVVLCCGIAAPAAALDEPWAFRDWRLSLTAVPTPEVTETLDRDVGRSVDVTWDEGDSGPGIRTGLETLGGTLDGGDGFIWGAGIGYTHWTIEPTGYQSEGTTFTASSANLEASSLDWRWMAGWAWGDRIGQETAWHAELVGFAGGGWSIGETETFIDSDRDGTIDSSSVDKGGGPMAEAGLRGAVGLIERNVELLFTVSWGWNKSWLDIDVPGGKSAVVLDASGFDFGLTFGYRF